MCPLQAMLSLTVMLSMDGWVRLLYDGVDAVGIDQQVFGFSPICSSAWLNCNMLEAQLLQDYQVKVGKAGIATFV